MNDGGIVCNTPNVLEKKTVIFTDFQNSILLYICRLFLQKYSIILCFLEYIIIVLIVFNSTFNQNRLISGHCICPANR